MKEVFVDCGCGHPNPAKALDPTLLEPYRANKDSVLCEKCGAKLDLQKAYLGEDIGGGTVRRLD